ncbi:hypothetical protein B0H13DRAFT_1534525, partial [Mycena leptocephala]
LESAHVGEFLTETMAEVKAKDEFVPSVPKDYTDPTQTVPKVPPPLCTDCDQMECNDCDVVSRWKSEYRETVDDLILRSNVHDCKRCLRKDGTCRSRFPRDLFMRTEVDPVDGYINVKKHEAWINTVTP